MSESFCPIHGPYDASLSSCPYPHSQDTVDVTLHNTKNDLKIDFEDSTEMPSNDFEEITTELPDPNLMTNAILWMLEGPRYGQIYRIKHGMIIGRIQGEIVLDDPKVSSIHAKLNLENNNCIIWDFGSSNGTYVNNKKIRKATALEDNDLVKIGDKFFVVKLLVPLANRKPRSVDFEQKKRNTVKPNKNKKRVAK